MFNKKFLPILILVLSVGLASWAFSQTSLEERGERYTNERQPPDKIMAAIGVKAGMVIGEVGAGRGRFTVQLADRVGNAGKIYANDIDQGSLEYLRDRCKRLGLNNVEIIHGKVDDPLFPKASLDMAFMILTYHHLAEPVALLKNLIPSLKPGATVVIVDPDPEKDKDRAGRESTSEEKIRKEAGEAGFELVRIETFLEKDNIFILRRKQLVTLSLRAEEIHAAAKAGDLATVKALIEKDRTLVNLKDDCEQTPLHLAAAAGRKEVADLLIAAGADIKAECHDGRNLLHCAAAGGLVDLAVRLLGEGFPVDRADHFGKTPLFYAAEAGSAPAAVLLLSKGAKVNSRDRWLSVPLHEASFSGNLQLLDILVKSGANVNAESKDGSTPLLYVSQAGRIEVAEWLLAHGAKLSVRNVWNETPLSWPLVNGFNEFVKTLYPRAEALKDKDLLEKYPLHRAAYAGNTEIVAFLLNKGVPIGLKDEDGRNPLHRAAQGGRVELARRLIENKADINAQDAQGATPLHLAVKKGKADMVRYLLQNGADAKAKDGQGRTPLDLARELAFPDIQGVLKGAAAEYSQSSERNDLPSLLVRPLKEGEAFAWYLGHCGFAVKTKEHLLVFDYWDRWKKPEQPSLANGFINPEEIKNLDVIVFSSHEHVDHFDPVILTWQRQIKNITYVFGWKARKGGRSFDMPAPRATAKIGNIEVFTVNSDHNIIPEVAYLVKIDGLAIYHSGDYVGTIDGFKADMEYLRGKAGTIDLAFIGLGGMDQAELLKPTVAFPLHAGDREYMYGAFAREATRKNLKTKVICPENKGDRFFFRKAP
jgi:ankyrin repeat protein/L-ascorbate metabolism protein UlaG (beta-lactamase superfamily)